LPEKPQDGDLGFLVAIGRKDRKKKAGKDYGIGQQKVDKKFYQPIDENYGKGHSKVNQKIDEPIRETESARAVKVDPGINPQRGRGAIP
jgi:hypothetical protein